MKDIKNEIKENPRVIKMDKTIDYINRYLSSKNIQMTEIDKVIDDLMNFEVIDSSITKDYLNEIINDISYKLNKQTNFHKDCKTREDYIEYLRKGYTGNPEDLFDMLADTVQYMHQIENHYGDLFMTICQLNNNLVKMK